MLFTQCSYYFLFVLLVAETKAARILGVFTVPSISHQIVFQPIWRELSLRGHNVTVLTPNPLNDPSLTNLTEIDLSFQYKMMEDHKQQFSAGSDHWTMLHQMAQIFAVYSKQIFSSDEVLKFIEDNSTTYDVALVEAMDKTTYAFAAKFKCPVIGIVSLGALSPTHEAVGNPGHPVLHADLMTPYYGGGEMGFIEKLDAVFFDLYHRYLHEYLIMPSINKIVRKHFGDETLNVGDIEKNMSLLLLNSNPILHKPRPYGPNVVEFGGGGIHIKPEKPLPSVNH